MGPNRQLKATLNEKIRKLKKANPPRKSLGTRKLVSNPRNSLILSIISWRRNNSNPKTIKVWTITNNWSIPTVTPIMMNGTTKAAVPSNKETKKLIAYPATSLKNMFLIDQPDNTSSIGGTKEINNPTASVN